MELQDEVQDSISVSLPERRFTRANLKSGSTPPAIRTQEMWVDNKIVQSASIAAETCDSSSRQCEQDGQDRNPGSPLLKAEPTVPFEITIPESMRDELDLAIQEIFQGRRSRMDALERDREAITTAAMKGLQTRTCACLRELTSARVERTSGAGDGNRTHGSSLGSLGITIIRRPRQGDSSRPRERMANPLDREKQKAPGGAFCRLCIDRCGVLS
jgi:hypothetical protein